jgi:DNA-binding NtrC family response regulator
MSCPKILVVDDDPNILSAFKSFFEKENYKMIGVNSAGKALEKIKSEKIALVISDVKMNAVSGVSLLMAIKNKNHNLPVIIISGYPELISEEDLKKLGADYFFEKPLELQNIRSVIKKLLKFKY